MASATAHNNHKNVPSNKLPNISSLGEVPLFAQFPINGSIGAEVFWSSNSNAKNPTVIVKGTNIDGSNFKVEVAINDINPSNASTVEMIALNGYLAYNGNSRLPLWLHKISERSSKISTGIDAFKPLNFLSAFNNHIKTQLHNRNFEVVMNLQNSLNAIPSLR